MIPICPTCSQRGQIGYAANGEIYLFCPNCFSVYDFLVSDLTMHKFAEVIKIIDG